MKTFSRYIKSLLILFAMVCLAGCADDLVVLGPDQVQDGDGDVILTLNVSVSNSRGSGVTRAFPFEPATIEYEKIHSLRVIIVNEKDTVEHNLRVDMAPGYGVDEVKGLDFKVSTNYGTEKRNENNQLIRTEKKRIYLIANEDAIPTGDNLPPKMFDIEEFLNEKLKPGSYFTESNTVIWNNWSETSGNAPTLPEYATPFINNEGANKKYVLMSEFFDVDVTSNLSVGGDQKTKANLFVTRNLVKFRFSITADGTTPSFKVKKVIFSNLMQKEYLFPNETIYNPPKYDADGKVTIEDREITSYVTPSFSHGDGNYIRPYIFEPENFGYNATSSSPTTTFSNTYEPNLYFCETKNLVKSDTDDTESDSELYTVGIEVEFQNKIKDAEGNEIIEPFTVQFDAKQLTNLRFLPRNTIVQVNMVINNGILEAVATVYPYTAVNLNPSYGFEIPSTRISLNETETSIEEGQTILIRYTIEPDITTDKTVTWTSSNTDIATVENGLVKGIAPGTVDITATTVYGQSATCKVTVTPKE